MSATTKVKTTFALRAFPPRIALPTFSTTTFHLTTKSLTTFVPTNNEHIAQFQLISKRGFAGKILLEIWHEWGN
jgi:hypothetical protein